MITLNRSVCSGSPWLSTAGKSAAAGTLALAWLVAVIVTSGVTVPAFGMAQDQAATAALKTEPKSAPSATAGHILGQLTDTKGQINYVGRAVVFLCDADSGMPILASTRKPLVPTAHMDAINDMWHTVTDERSVFEFKEVPPGRYRLVAQSWSGTEGKPDFQSKPSTVVILHGIANNVEVKANMTTRAYPRQLGEGLLKIVNDPEEAHAFLLISLEPTLGDGILGPAGWGPKFLSNVIGVTQMERPHVTIMGLPETKIHVGLFNYDNSPGVGADSYVVGKEREVRLRILATWSNGKYEPPARLLKLVDYIDQNKLTLSQLVGRDGSDGDNRKELIRMLLEQPDQIIEVDGVGKFRFADVMAAVSYQALRAAHLARKQRHQNPRPDDTIDDQG